MKIKAKKKYLKSNKTIEMTKTEKKANYINKH